jgi:hypothetical protein
VIEAIDKMAKESGKEKETELLEIKSQIISNIGIKG